MTNDWIGFPVFRGLQKPLEFMGIRGRFMMLAAVTVGATIICFFVTSFFGGGGVAFGTSIIVLGVGLVTIYTRQKQGLHNKKHYNGIIICRNIFRNHL